MKKLIFLFSVIFLAASCKAQPSLLSTKSKKAEKAYNAAMQYADMFDFEHAYEQLAIAEKEDPQFVEAYTLEANMLMTERKWDKAIEKFQKAFSINPNFFPGSFYDCANAELKLGRYADAKKDFQAYLDKHGPTATPSTISTAQQGIDDCDFAMNAIAHPVPYNPLNMGESINGPGCEYFPNVTADDATFLFTRNEEKKDPNSGALIRTQEDFYISYKDENGKWSVAKNLGPPINTNANEGAPSLSADGRFLFFAACADDYDGYGSGRVGLGACDIFFSQKVNGVWSKPQNVGTPVNGPSWDSQPSFSSDGKTLYFVSHRKGGFGDSDIWMAVLGNDGKWGPAINLGPGINTEGREEAVFIHPDNQTLYFASDGLTGMGGLDLYVCRRDSVTGKWGKPTNLGYPINTAGDESGLIVNGNGQMAYFSSTDRAGGLGCDDIYMFSLPKQFQPVPVTYMKGKTFNKKTGKPVGNAAFELIDIASGKTVVTSFSDAVTGEFLVCLPVNEDYALNVNASGYAFYSESFQLKKVTDANKPFRMDVPLQPIEDSAHGELKNVFFETGKFDLRPESKAELNKLVTWLKTNPNVKIELQGHTDNVGDKKSNMTLSNNRAKAVYDYLVANGIEASRLTYKGYGDTKPKVPNDTPEHRQMNRRTEYMITSTK
jgi:outer membrane protein OmpA-like peptidoglycan-associated protein